LDPSYDFCPPTSLCLPVDNSLRIRVCGSLSVGNDSQKIETNFLSVIHVYLQYTTVITGYINSRILRQAKWLFTEVFVVSRTVIVSYRRLIKLRLPSLELLRRLHQDLVRCCKVPFVLVKLFFLIFCFQLRLLLLESTHIVVQIYISYQLPVIKLL